MTTTQTIANLFAIACSPKRFYHVCSAQHSAGTLAIYNAFSDINREASELTNTVNDATKECPIKGGYPSSIAAIAVETVSNQYGYTS